MIHEYEFSYKDEKNNPVPNMWKFDVLITTYEMILAECMELQSVPWRIIIIDEAHRLKNRNCKLLTGLTQLNVVRHFVAILYQFPRFAPVSKLERN